MLPHLLVQPQVQEGESGMYKLQEGGHMSWLVLQDTALEISIFQVQEDNYMLTVISEYH